MGGDPRASAQGGFLLCFWLSPQSTATHEGGPAGKVQVTVLCFPHSPEMQWGKGVCSSESPVCVHHLRQLLGSF